MADTGITQTKQMVVAELVVQAAVAQGIMPILDLSNRQTGPLIAAGEVVVL